jgi:hypothetical protein
MIVDRVLQSMELQDRKRLGRKNWQRKVYKVVADLREALEAGHLVLGGGNAKKLKKTLKKMPLSTDLGRQRELLGWSPHVEHETIPNSASSLPGTVSDR